MGLLSKRAHSLGALCCLYLLIAPFLVMPASSAIAEPSNTKRVPLVLVVSKESKLDSISLSDLKRRYNGSNGSRNVIPFNLPAGSPERSAFDKAVLGLGHAQVGRYWIDRKIRGQSSAPRSLTNTLQVAKVVARFPGAIGYIRADKLPSWVKPLEVSGKKHTEKGYALYVEVPE